MDGAEEIHDRSQGVREEMPLSLHEWLRCNACNACIHNAENRKIKKGNPTVVLHFLISCVNAINMLAQMLKMLATQSFYCTFEYAEYFAPSIPPSIRNIPHSQSLSCAYASLPWKRCIPIRTSILDRIRTPNLTLMVSRIIERWCLRRINWEHVERLTIAVTLRLRIGIKISHREDESLSHVQWIQSRYQGFDTKETALVVHRAFEMLRFDTRVW